MLHRLQRLFVLGCLGGASWLAPGAQAATYTVTSLQDSTAVNGCTAAGSGDGCTLREAITAANATPAETDTITFANGLAGNTLTLTSALPDLNTNLSILNPAAQTITLARSSAPGTAAFRLLTVVDGPTVALQGLTLTGGTSPGGDGGGFTRDVSGAGLYVESSTLSLTNCVLTGNSGSRSGGGLSSYDGRVTLTNCTVSNNASLFGGGLDNPFGVMTLVNCTVSGNKSVSSGGGIYNFLGTLTLANCTLANNAVTADLNSSGNGGGLSSDRGTVTMRDCTVTGNTVPANNNRGGGLEVTESRTMLSNCIVVGNTDSDLELYGVSSNTYVSSGYNLVGTSRTGALTGFTQPGDRTGVTPSQIKLGALASNGGPTPTVALLRGSLAIDAGSTDQTTDQRGVRRPVGNADDVGAFEFNGPFSESLVVTTASDEDNGTSDPSLGVGTSLREAINFANSNPDASTITFVPALSGGTLTLLSALPELSTDLNIRNTSARSITLARSRETGTPIFRLLTVNNGTTSGPTVELVGLTLTNGATLSSGSPRETNGGGLYNRGGVVRLLSCTLVGNTAGGTPSNSANGAGGGLFSEGGTVALFNSTVAGNSTAYFGGGLCVAASTLTLANSTVSGNTAYEYGGGIFSDTSDLTLSSCTVSGNIAPDNRGNGITAAAGSVTLGNTILAGNVASDLDAYPGTFSTYISNGYNLVGKTTNGSLGAFNRSGDVVGVTAALLKLAPLQNNGGLTPTRDLQPGSLALNVGNPDTQGLPATDQRGTGFSRVVNGRLDVGAIESQAVVLRGRVFNAVGLLGLSGIAVQASRSDVVGAPVVSTVTDRQGNYTFSLNLGRYNITASNPNNAQARFRSGFTNPVELTSAGTGGVFYDLRAVGIGGRVINPSNIGVAGVTLTAQSDTASATQISDADGFFSFDMLPAGTYTLTPSSANNLVFSPTSRTLTLQDAPLFTSFVASVQINYALSGLVTSGGQGVSGVTVSATRVSDGRIFTARTGSDGGYTLSALSEGRYTVAAQANGLVFTYTPTPNQPQPLVLTAQSPTKAGLNFTARRVIGGTVYNSLATQGVSRIVVRAVRQSDGATFATGTDTSGRYSLTLDAGTYTFSAFLPNNNAYPISPVFSNPVTIAAAIPNGNLSYDFRVVGISGRVISPTNVGIAGVTVNLYAPRDTALGNPLRSVVTDAQGFFSLDGIVPGTWNVVPVGPTTYNYTPGSRLIEVQNQAVFTSFRASVKPS